MAGGEGEEVGQAGPPEPGSWQGYGLAPEPGHLSQSWRQVLSRIKKASFSVGGPGQTASGTSSLGAVSWRIQFLFQRNPIPLRRNGERDKLCLSKSFAA